MPINHHVTRSSMITEMEYDEAEKLLRLKFAKGGWYEYQDVPEEVYQELLNAESIGKYFLASIKGKFPTEKIV
jgi:hypothetical protein